MKTPCGICAAGVVAHSTNASPATVIRFIAPILRAVCTIISTDVLKMPASPHEPRDDQERRQIRLDAIGQVAGGLAHDFNNLLTVILGYCNALDDQLDEGDPRREDVAQIRSAGERASRMTRQVLAFSGRQVLQPVILNPAELVAGLQGKLAALLGDRVQLTVTRDPNASPIEADQAQLELVLANLAANAREAMPDGGRCSIGVANVQLDAGAGQALGLEPGPYVEFSVADTGSGIEPSLRQRLFEPFATMKSRGKGPGLGLPTAYGIARQSGGSMSVQSEPGQGSTFRIYLPAKTGAAAAARKPGDSPKGTETVLVVDAEPAVRVLVQNVLKRAGYTVLTALSPAEGIRMASDPARAIDLIVCDATLADMTGADLLARVRDARPTLRGLLISGLPADVVAQKGLLPAGTPFLQKPFTGTDLTWKIREVLDEERR